MASHPKKDNNHLQPRWFKVTFLIPLLVGGYEQPFCNWVHIYSTPLKSEVDFSTGIPSQSIFSNLVLKLRTRTTERKSSREGLHGIFSPKRIRHRLVGLAVWHHHAPPIFGSHVVPCRDHFHAPSVIFWRIWEKPLFLIHMNQDGSHNRLKQYFLHAWPVAWLFFFMNPWMSSFCRMLKWVLTPAFLPVLATLQRLQLLAREKTLSGERLPYSFS